MKNMKKVLLFQIKKEKEAQIKALCRELGIDVVIVNQKQYLEPIGVLAGIQGIPRFGKIYEGMVIPLEMMVFSGIEQELLDIFLQKYRELSIEPIGLKAVITPTNIFWNTKQLYDELLKEHQSFQRS